MSTKIVINNTYEFGLIKWNAQEFNQSLTLHIQSTDFSALKRAFETIERIDIIQDDAVVASYTYFDTFSQITYVGKSYVDSEKRFAESMDVTLTKSDIVAQVQRLDEQINPVIDLDNMTVDEYKAYKIQELSRQCTESIYSGDQVTLSDGTTETFTFDQYDQVDLTQLAQLAMMDPTIELTWHSSGNTCKFYSGVDIIKIYGTLNMKLFKETTIFNALNLLIQNAQSKDEVNNYYWGCDLPQEERGRVMDLILRMQVIISNIMDKIIPKQ